MVFKQGKESKWYCRFCLSDGTNVRRLCRGATTKAEAEKIEQEMKHDLELQLRGFKSKEQKNYFEHLVQLYTEHVKCLSKQKKIV